MIEINNISKKYGKNIALNDVSFSIKENTTLGLLGQNGAGKTTLMDIICGCTLADTGSISINSLRLKSSAYKYKQQISYVPERPPLYNDMTVIEYLTFVSNLKQLVKSDITQHLNEIINLTGLNNMEHRLIANLSKGYKQRLAFAQALIGSPQVLVFDEPTVGLDPKQIADIISLIKALSKTHTIIISSHRLYEIQQLCSDYVILHKGELKHKGKLVGNDENCENLNLEIIIDSKDLDILQNIKQLNCIKNIEHISKLSYNGLNCDKYNLACFGICFPEVEIGNIFLSKNKLIYGICRNKTSLEDIFLNITK